MTKMLIFGVVLFIIGLSLVILPPTEQRENLTVTTEDGKFSKVDDMVFTNDTIYEDVSRVEVNGEEITLIFFVHPHPIVFVGACFIGSGIGFAGIGALLDILKFGGGR